jgi:hypothetical protein
VRRDQPLAHPGGGCRVERLAGECGGEPAAERTAALDIGRLIDP